MKLKEINPAAFIVTFPFFTLNFTIFKLYNNCSSITKLRNNGILKRIESMLEITATAVPSGYISQQKFHPVTILDVALLLAILFGGIIFSIVILLFEKIQKRNRF